MKAALRLVNRIAMAAAVVLLGTGLFAPIESLAAAKAITSVRLNVTQSMEAGMAVRDIKTGSAAEDGIKLVVAPADSTKYTVSKISVAADHDPIGAADKVSVIATVSPKDAASYSFSGTYSSSNVTVKNGTFSGVSKKGGNLQVSFTIMIKGQYETPDDPHWNTAETKIGQAVWDAPETTSGYYDLILYRGTSKVKEINGVKGSNYNFYPYMTTKGTYSYKIRTAPHTTEEKVYAKASAWEISDEFYVDAAHVAPAGLAASDSISSENKVGWVYDDEYWYYRYPNGSLKTNGWAHINNKWYLFDEKGRMLTGWQTVNGNTYYLDSTNGDMRSGWLEWDGKWYYLKTDASSSTYGAMLRSTWLNGSDGKPAFYLDSNGAMAMGWRQIGDYWYYFNASTGRLAVNTTIDTFRVDAQGRWIP